MDKVIILPLNDVKIKGRMRKDIGDLSGLMDSISRLGLIQPIVVDDDNFLIAGERRYRAHEALSLKNIKCIRRQDAPPDVQAEMEFEENFWRKSMTWQEECLGMLNIYRKKKTAAALEGWIEPYQQVVSRMFGMAVGTLNYILAVAKKLEDEKDPAGYWHSFSSANEAYRIGLCKQEEMRIDKYNAEELKRNTNTPTQQKEAAKMVQEVKTIEQSPDLLDEARQRYQSNPLNTVPFEQYWADKQATAEKHAREAANTIYISNIFHHADSIEMMNSKDWRDTFDHIITDPPYAIPMDNLLQNGDGLVELDLVVDAHQVEENMELLAKFFPAAFKCTREKAYVCVCCDPDLWDYQKQLALKAGFAVQRWPYIWRKINQSIKNQCPQFNSTKDYEMVMICRKPSTAVANKRNTSFTDASNVTATKETGHPFAKPYELTRDLVEMVSLKGQLILDPFAGGGSMVTQMLRMERRVIGVEKEEHWFNSLIGNVKNLFYLRINPDFIFK